MMINKFAFKQAVSLALAFFSLAGMVAQENKRPTVALVLSGGGAKGFAHVGVLKVLEQEGIPIDMVVGTSIGAVVGGMYAIGYSPAEIEEMVKGEDWKLLLTDEIPRTESSYYIRSEKQRYLMSLPVNDALKIEVPQAAMRGHNVLNLFCNLAGNVPENADFDSFPIRFACIGADVATGKEVVINKGFLPTAIYSSMAIPGVFTPILHEDHMMIDGGVVNNLPADVAKRMGADIIIGVDIRNDLYKRDEIKSIKEILDQLITFYSIEKDSANKSYCSVLVRPDIAGYDASSFSSRAADTLINKGMAAATALLPELRGLKEKYGLQARHVGRDLVKTDTWRISKITVGGNYSATGKLIEDNLQLEVPGKYSYRELKKAIDRVYGLGCMDKVMFRLRDDRYGEKELILDVSERKSAAFNLGVRVNTTDAIAVLANYSRRSYGRYFSYHSIFANISSNPELKWNSEFSKGKWPVVGLGATGKYREYKLFRDGEKINSSEVYYGAGSVYFYKPIRKNAQIGIGTRIELFRNNFFSSNSVPNPVFELLPSTTSVSNLSLYWSKDTFDDYYFPTRGGEYHSDITFSKDLEGSGICPVFTYKIRKIFGIGSRLGLLASFYGRAVMDDNLPMIKQNFVGGHDYELYFDNHLPFYGIPAIMDVQRYATVNLLGLRAKVSANNYVSVIFNALLHTNDMKELPDFKSSFGYALDYQYKSIIGPMGITVGYSDDYQKPVVSANIGMWF
ncbi:MAG: patatin-like phospholipase family protein [Breznakibacter sp.]